MSIYAVHINNNFLGSKHALCCIPLSSCDGVEELRKVFEKCPDKMAVGGLAINEATN